MLYFVNHFRRAMLLVTVLSVSLLAYVYYLQFVRFMQPCSMCLAQRYALVFMAFFAIASMTFSNRHVLQLTCTWLVLIFAVIGAVIAAWQSWLHFYPSKTFMCGSSLLGTNDFLSFRGLGRWLFNGSSDCSLNDDALLGVSIPNWSFIFFLLMIIFVSYVIKRNKKRL